MSEAYHPGLEGIIAGETAICTVEQDDLAYYGYKIDDLAEHASFEEVAWLLLHGELPKAAELAGFRRELDDFRTVPPAVLAALRAIPADVEGMDVLRTAVSLCGNLSPIKGHDRSALVRQATHLLGVIPSIIAARIRLVAGKEPLTPRPGLSHPAQFLYLVSGQTPSAVAEQLLNLTLVLYAEHEFNASAFAARVCASTLSDLYSCVVAGIGTLKGPLHGGANEESAKLITRFASAAEAKAWTEQAIQHKEKIMGFGHRVYKNGDHRAHILEPYMEKLAAERKEQRRVEVYHAIKNTVWERKKIHINVDFPCGLTYWLMDLPIDAYTPIFVASRVSGWSAHTIEQLLNNRIIRPRSRYVGPPMRAYVPAAKR